MQDKAIPKTSIKQSMAGFTVSHALTKLFKVIPLRIIDLENDTSQKRKWDVKAEERYLAPCETQETLRHLMIRYRQ